MCLCQKLLLHFYPKAFVIDSKQSFYYNPVPKLELGNEANAKAWERGECWSLGTRRMNGLQQFSLFTGNFRPSKINKQPVVQWWRKFEFPVFVQ